MRKERYFLEKHLLYLLEDLLNGTRLYKCNVSATNSAECHGIVFSWLCPLDCRPPSTRTRSTLTRVRLAVSGLGGCFCQQSFNERKWNTSPCPPPAITCTTYRGRRPDWTPASSLQSSSGNATSSVFRKLRHNSSGLLSGRCLSLQARWTVASPTRFSVHVFVQLFLY